MARGKKRDEPAPSWQHPETMGSFRELLKNLMETHGQDANLYRISNRTGLSYPSLDKWAKGTGFPNLASRPGTRLELEAPAPEKKPLAKITPEIRAARRDARRRTRRKA